MSGILRTARAIFSILSPMTGTGSTGNLTVASTSGTPVLPKNTYCVPIVGGAPNYDALLKTTAATTLSTSGVSVPCKSILGGTQANLAAATSVRWNPQQSGVQAASVVASGGLTGGAFATSFGSVKSIRMYEQIGTAQQQRDLFAAKVGRFPALVLMWDSSPTAERASKRESLVDENFVLAVVASRLDSDEERRAEGLHIMEEASERLHGRCAVDGEVFSAPEPLLVNSRQRLVTTESSYIYVIRFSVQRTLVGREPTRTFANLDKFRHDASTADAPVLPVITDFEFDNS